MKSTSCNYTIYKTQTYHSKNRQGLLASPFVFGLLCCLQFLAAPKAEALQAGWTAAENSNLWDAQSGGSGSTSNNWAINSIPGADDLVYFDDSILINPIRTIHLNGNRSVDSVVFQNGSYTLGTTVGGETLTIGRGSEFSGYGIASTASGDALSNTINSNIALNDTSGDNTFGIYIVQLHEVTIRGIVSGSNSIQKKERGTLVLTNANSYTGGTTIARGTLRVSNTTGSATGTGNVVVEPDSSFPVTLSGTGRIGGAITVESGGTIAPGNSIGTLTALSGVTLNGTYACEIGGTAADRLAVTGTLDVRNGTLQVSQTSAWTGSSYTIATATQVQGPFATVTGLPAGYSIVYSDTSIVIRPTITFHVDAAAAPGGTGASWGDALKTIDEALALVADGEQIWVKQGVHVPGGGSADPYSTFDVPNGVDLLGGFDGTETSESERDPSSNLTVLSGDLGGDDTNKVDGITTTPADIVGTNAYSVVTVSFAAPTIDGFTITGGSAAVTPIANPGGESRGGGVFVDTDYARVPTLSNCRLYGNTAVQGGGIFVHSKGGCDIVSCDFRSNSASGRGGAAYYWWSNVTTKNSNFSGNYAGDDGGAIYDDPQGWGTSLIVNCTITGNRAFDGGGGINANTTGSSSSQMINTLIWNNSAGRAPTINNLIFYDFTHCLLENNDLTGSGTGNFNAIGGANDPGFFLSLDPALAPSISGDFRPSPDATLLDAGDNSSITGVSLDLSGEPRILAANVDIGAYEGSLYSDYTWWINDYFPGETDPAIVGAGADPGENGLNNALSFITGTSPLATEPVQTVGLSSDATYRWFNRPDTTEGVAYFNASFDYSSNLEGFIEVPFDTVSGTEIEPGITFVRANGFIGLRVDEASHPKMFVRLGVDVP